MTAPMPFGSIERAVKLYLISTTIFLEDQIGGDLAYEAGEQTYVYIAKTPGGTADKISGTFVVDIDVFDTNYLVAEQRALEIEAAMVNTPYVITDGDYVWVIDRVFVNTSAAPRPWEDDKVSRIGGTYTLTSRRRG